MNFTFIKETCLYVSDIQRAHDFYHNLLELDIVSLVPERHVFFRVGPSMLLCFNPEATRNETRFPAHHATGPQHLAFEVPKEEYIKWKEKIIGKGIAITHEHSWNKEVESFYFCDPDQNVLEIVPSGMWDA